MTAIRALLTSSEWSSEWRWGRSSIPCRCCWGTTCWGSTSLRLQRRVCQAGLVLQHCSLPFCKPCCDRLSFAFFALELCPGLCQGLCTTLSKAVLFCKVCIGSSKRFVWSYLVVPEFLFLGFAASPRFLQPALRVMSLLPATSIAAESDRGRSNALLAGRVTPKHPKAQLYFLLFVLGHGLPEVLFFCFWPGEGIRRHPHKKARVSKYSRLNLRFQSKYRLFCQSLEESPAKTNMLRKKWPMLKGTFIF